MMETLAYLAVAADGETEEIIEELAVQRGEDLGLTVDDAQLVLQLDAVHQQRADVRLLAEQLQQRTAAQLLLHTATELSLIDMWPAAPVGHRSIANTHEIQSI